MALLSCNYRTEINKTALNTGSSLLKLVSHAIKATQLFGKLQLHRLIYYLQLLLTGVSNDCNISVTHLLLTLFKCDNFTANNSVLVIEVPLSVSVFHLYTWKYNRHFV